MTKYRFTDLQGKVTVFDNVEDLLKHIQGKDKKDGQKRT